jgi:branched-chain amino acid transport system permease protein
LESWDSLTNGTDGIIITYRPEPIPLPFGGQVAFETRTDFYFLALALAVLTCMLIIAIVRSRIGRVLIAIREDEILVLAAGYNVMRYKVFAFFVSALFAGLAGGFYAPYMTFILPNNYEFDEMIFMIVVTIVGGRATVAGPLLGCALLVSFPYLLDVNATLRMVAYGAILVGTILYFPEGIVGVLKRLRTPDRSRIGTGGVRDSAPQRAS